MISHATEGRLRVFAVAVAPVVLLAGFLIRPYLSNPRDPAVNAAAVLAGPTRWISAHIVIMFGLALIVLSILAIRFWLDSRGEQEWSFVSVILVTTGAVGLVFLVGQDGLGGWAVVDSGGDAEAFFASARTFEGPMFAIAATLLGLGLAALAVAVVRSRALSRIGTVLVIAGVAVAVSVPLLPVGWAVYALSIAAGVASWPLAWRMHQDVAAATATTRA
jgi:hypothetical protein